MHMLYHPSFFKIKQLKILGENPPTLCHLYVNFFSYLLACNSETIIITYVIVKPFFDLLIILTINS